MNAITLEAQIKSLETQLAVLKAQLGCSGSGQAAKPFADLYGILKGKASSSEQDIAEAEYGFQWEGTEEK